MVKVASETVPLAPAGASQAVVRRHEQLRQKKQQKLELRRLALELLLPKTRQELAAMGSRQKLVYHLALRAVDLEESAARAARTWEVGRQIREELQATSWVQSSEFQIEHVQEHNMLKLVGPGDPSGIGAGFCYLRDRHKIRSAKKADGKYYGTDSDARRLTTKEREDILVKQGMGIVQLRKLERWDQVRAIQHLAAMGKGGRDITQRFARDSRATLPEQRERYSVNVRKIWEKQRDELGDGSERPGVDSRFMAPPSQLNLNGEATAATFADGAMVDVDGFNDSLEKNDSSDGSDGSDDDDMDDIDDMLQQGSPRRRSSGAGGGVRPRDVSFVNNANNSSNNIDDDQRELEALLMGGAKGASSASSPSLLPSSQAADQPMVGAYYTYENKPPPTKAVRRVVRYVNTKTGEESTVVEYRVGNIEDVTAVAKREKHRRQEQTDRDRLRGQWVRDGGVHVGGGPGDGAAHPGGGRRRNRNGGGGGGGDPYGLSPEKQGNGKVITIPNPALKSAVAEKGVRGGKPAGGKGKGQTINFSSLLQKKADEREAKKTERQAKAREQMDMYKRPKGGTSKARGGGGGGAGAGAPEMTAVGSSHYSRGDRKAGRGQKPHVVLSRKFLGVIDAIIERPDSGVFRRPVPATIPGYREKVKNPIDLSVIRDR